MNYVIGNWKANKTIGEASAWMYKFLQQYEPSPKIKVILCPSFTHLTFFANKQHTLKIPLYLAAQDLSAYSSGAYTGEISAQMLTDLVEYSLIGHSERRTYQKEDDKLIEKKIKQALKHNIKPILCVQSATSPVPNGVEIVAYEPVKAIGTNKPADAASVNRVIAKVKKMHPNVKIGIYGGSVNAENVVSFISQPKIDGVLPGGASLDAVEFARIIQNASQIQT